MFKKLMQISLFTTVCFCSLFAVTNYPFPQQATYPNGVLPKGVDHKRVQMVYDNWLKTYYTESGDQARIKFDEPANTVSEGIGYGMLIMVFMDNTTNKTQAKFDKLWKYYNSHLDGNGLMNWKVEGFSGNTPGTGAATDAELDVAVALIMADKQWGGNYLNDAKTLIEKIFSKEVANNLLKGGDGWDALNPSYMSMVAVELFNAIDPKWGAVKTACYTLLEKNQAKSSAGLWSNWCDASGNPGGGVGSDPGIYGFDASRTPWRLGWAYVWYGHSTAKTLCNTMVSKMTAKIGSNPAASGQMYTLEGTIHSTGNTACIPTFLGPFTVAGMVDAANSTWLNNGYTKLLSFNAKDDNYYNECLELLSMLLLTGNMPNFTKVAPRTSATVTAGVRPAGAGTVTLSPQKASYAIGDQATITTTAADASRYTFVGWEGDLTGTTPTATLAVTYNMVITAVYRDEKADDLLDDCEDNDGMTNLLTEWFTYTDVKDTGKSTVTPFTDDGKVPFAMTSGGYNSSKYAAKISWKLDKGGFTYDPFVGLGFELGPDAAYVDISKSTGISFFYKGTFGTKDTCDLKIECGAVTTSGADYSYNLTPTTTWTEVNLTWDKFLQPKWVTGTSIVALDLKKINKIQWQIHGVTGAASELWIDDVHLIGYPIPKSTNTDNAPARHLSSRALSLSQSLHSVSVSYTSGKSGEVSLSLFDLTGRLVTTLVREYKKAGSYSVVMSTNDEVLGNNSYILKLSTPDGVYTRPLIVTK